MNANFQNHIRNILLFVVLGFGAIEFAFYLSGVFFILSVWGVDAIDFKAINPNPFDNFPYRLWPTIFDYVGDWSSNRARYDDVVTAKLFACFTIPLAFLSIILWSQREQLMSLRFFKEEESLHGDARWATEKDIRKIGLRSKRGLLLGKDKKGYLIADGYQHALLFAPTGSGKGVGFVIPNLLFWEDSVVVHDIKLENYEITSGWRMSQGHSVYVWSPADANGRSHCYNPLDWISPKPGQMVDDVQKIANLIMPDQDFWQNEARSLFVGIVLYLLVDDKKTTSFGEVVRTMRSDDVVYNLAVVLDTLGKDLHPVAYMNIAAFLQKADKERSGVISTMNSSLELWANPLIDTATATSDFSINDFKKKKITLYVGLTPDNLTRLRPLMQVFYQQATEFLCRSLPKPNEPYGVLFLMDEFPTLGEMEQFKTGIAYFRGYRVRLFLIIQDTEQLKGIYEESGMNSFLSNSTYRITFAANNVETANLISQLVGNKTVAQKSLNRPKYLDLNPGSMSFHVSDTQRALLLPQEVIMLPRDEQILLIESSYPIKSKKITYYSDTFFTHRLLKKTFIPTQEPYDVNKFRTKTGDDSKAVDEGANVNQAQNTQEKLAALPDSNKSQDEYAKAQYDNTSEDYMKESDIMNNEEYEEDNEEYEDDDEEYEDEEYEEDEDSDDDEEYEDDDEDQDSDDEYEDDDEEDDDEEDEDSDDEDSDDDDEYEDDDEDDDEDYEDEDDDEDDSKLKKK